MKSTTIQIFSSLLSSEQKKSIPVLFLVFWGTEEQFCTTVHLEEGDVSMPSSSLGENIVISSAGDLGVQKGDWICSECKTTFYPEINECQCISLCIFFLLWNCAVQPMENIFWCFSYLPERMFAQILFIALFSFPLKWYMLKASGSAMCVLLEIQHTH